MNSRRLWPAVKVVVVCAIVAAVAWQFVSILRAPELWQSAGTVRAGTLVLAAGLYLGGLGMSALCWYWLLRVLGQQPSIGLTARAFYLGQLGRYIPGKLVGLALRARLLSGSGVRGDVA